MVAISDTARMSLVIAITTGFLVTELIIGFKAGALVLVADAFHCLNDIITFVVALTAARYVKRQDAPASMPFGWQRAAILGSFFNGVFLLALGVSIFLQAIERFIALQPIENPKALLIVGAVGVVVNVTMAFIYHGHDDHDHGSARHEKDAAGVSNVPIGEMVHDMESTISIVPHHLPSQTRSTYFSRAWRFLVRKVIPKDLGRQAVVLHVLSDAANNVGVMAASLIMIFAKSKARFYADPAMSVVLAMGIFAMALPVVKRSGKILLGSIPDDVTIHQVERTLEAVDGVKNVHNVVVWRLSEAKCVVTAHVVVETTDAGESGQIKFDSEKGGVEHVTNVASENAFLVRLAEALREALAPTEIYNMTLQIERQGTCSEPESTTQDATGSG